MLYRAPGQILLKAFVKMTLVGVWVRFALVRKVNWPLRAPSKGFVVVGAHELNESSLANQAV